MIDWALERFGADDVFIEECPVPAGIARELMVKLDVVNQFDMSACYKVTPYLFLSATRREPSS